MRFSLVLFVLIFGFAKSADAQTIKNGSTKVVGVGQVEAKQQRLSKGGVIFEQAITPVHVISLTQDVDIFVRKTGNAHVKIVQGTQLYRVMNDKQETAYCTYGPAYFVTPGIGKPFSLQACLGSTTSADGLDKLYLSEKGQMDLPPLSHSRLRAMKTMFEPVEFERTLSDGTLNQPARVIVSKLKQSRVSFDIEALSSDGEWMPLGRIKKAVDNAPEVFDVFGAQIEINDINENGIALTVLSGLSSETPFIFSYDRMYSKKGLDFVKLED